ncbi:MAG TPA: hypothetical protein VM051_07525 [Usitatibacter sp.]|nr:hypothetical protein [Usitatibacter sp.]
MTKPLQGAIAGVIFGALTVATMVPMEFTDKAAALSAAFVDRFAIGLVIGCVALAWPGWLVGLAFGLLLSLPSAMITHGFIPIVAIGAVGGAVIGAVIHRKRNG